MEHYRRKYSKIKGSMKLEHEAGKEMFIDYAGKTSNRGQTNGRSRSARGGRGDTAQ
jgi:hypothetical protein